MKYDMKVINDYLDRGLIVKQVHPTLPIAIYNYSRTCQYDGLWDDITTNMRATTLDNEGNVVGMAFKKFFNMEELADVPKEEFVVYEKLDGSLITIFKYRGELVVTSKGSFVSDQAMGARKFIEDIDATNAFTEGYSFVYEYIAPENRIVVDYGNARELVALAIFNAETGEELHHMELVAFNPDKGIRIAKRFLGIEDYSTLKSKIKDNEEGFIVKFKSGLRMKIKGDEYVRLHRILTNFSTTDIWKLLKEGGNMNQFLDRVPDEFDRWVRESVRDLVVRYENIERDYLEIYSNLKAKNLDRREFAERAIRYRHSSILFSMLDGRPYSETIYKIIKPKHSKPFAND